MADACAVITAGMTKERAVKRPSLAIWILFLLEEASSLISEHSSLSEIEELSYKSINRHINLPTPTIFKK